MSPADAARIMARLSAAYPRWAVSEATATAYAEGLADMHAADVEAAAREWVRQRPSPPSVAELRALTRDLRRERVQTEGMAALPEVGADTPERRAKGRAQAAVLAAWSRGEIDTATLVERIAEVYVGHAPYPADSAAREVMAAHLTMAERLRERGDDGPLLQHLRRARQGGRVTWLPDTNGGAH